MRYSYRNDLEKKRQLTSCPRNSWNYCSLKDSIRSWRCSERNKGELLVSESFKWYLVSTVLHFPLVFTNIVPFFEFHRNVRSFSVFRRRKVNSGKKKKRTCPLTVRPIFFASVASAILAKGLSAPQHSTYFVILLLGLDLFEIGEDCLLCIHACVATASLQSSYYSRYREESYGDGFAS